MKIKVSEASGPVLDWLAAKAMGFTVQLSQRGTVEASDHDYFGSWGWNYFGPSTNWSQGGPIIDREEINLEIHEGGHTRASFYKMRLTFDGRAKHYHHQFGPTPLIAAMRCFVASRMDDEAEVPDELA